MKPIYFLFVAILMIQSCVYDPPYKGDQRFKIINHSKMDIYTFASLDTNLNELLFNNHDENKWTFTAGKPYDSINIGDTIHLRRVSNWDYMLSLNSKDSSIYIYIFHKNTVKQHGWEYVVNNKLYSKRFHLKEKELKTMQWKVIYK